jgi:hypothetical protein
MEKKTGSANKFIKIALWVVVILALLATTHVLVNNFHLFELIKKMHGG